MLGLSAKGENPAYASFTAPDLGGNLAPRTNSSRKMNNYYPVIARAVERLDRSTGETRRTVYERAREAIAQLPSNQPALLDADIIKERLALEEAILKVEAGAARNLVMQTGAEPRWAAPSGDMSVGDKIQTDDHGSRLHRTQMIDRQLRRADKHQYSRPSPPITGKTQMFRPSRLAELTAPIIITMMSRTRAGGAVSSS